MVGVRIQTTNGDTKLFRNGDYPVMRRTAVILDDRNAYLWTSGYVPRLDTYIGPETPSPLINYGAPQHRLDAEHPHGLVGHHGIDKDQLQRLQLQRRFAGDSAVRQ